MKTDATEVKHEWILGVFDDLITYAKMQNLDDLASQMIEMKEASRQEIERKSATKYGQDSIVASIPRALFPPAKLN
jgi:hypothetical protein